MTNSAQKNAPWQALAGNIKNIDGTTPIYNAGMWTFNGFGRFSTPVPTQSAAGNETFNCANQHSFLKTAGTATLAFNDFAEGQTINIVMVSTGIAYTLTWPVGIKWPQGVAPIPTGLSGQYDVYTFIKIGGIIFGMCAKGLY